MGGRSGSNGSHRSARSGDLIRSRRFEPSSNSIEVPHERRSKAQETFNVV